MSDQVDLQPIQQALNNSHDVLIVLPQNPNFDQVAAGLGLYLSLKKSDKSVAIACSSLMVVEFSRLVGLDKVKTSVGNKNLVVSFDYIQDSIEKVTYNVEGNKFNLVVQPKKGSKPLDSKNVTFSYSGMKADIIFIIGAKSLGEIGEIYSNNQESFTAAYTISINIALANHFAQTSIVDNKASSISEIVAWFLEQSGFAAIGDSASNLLSGIDKATNRFSDITTQAAAFITAGKLMQNGGVRQEIIAPRPAQPSVPTLPLVRPMSIAESKEISPSQDQLPLTTNPPKEWLEPKIFQGSSKV